jgi:hypothetical protein
MPIDFNQPAFFDPKIDIIGKEVPLAEIEKTGNVLQNRFDKSYEQYSAADEALKQMEARANPVDREKAKELRSIYKEEMDKILEQGDFHNMRRQTENLARNAAINYKVIEEKNAAIQKGLEEIAKSPKYQLDPEGAKQDYLKSLQSINFNPETRTISDFNVGAYNAASDFHTADKLLQIAPTLRAKLLKAKGSYFGTRTLPTGEKVNTIETEGGGYRILDSKEIEDELKSYIVTDPAFQAYITRDVGRMGLDPKSEEGKVAYDQLVAERTADTSKALGKMYEIDENMSQTTFTVPDGDVNNNGPGKDKEIPEYTLRPSVPFKLNSDQPLFKLNEKGDIVNTNNSGIISGWINDIIQLKAANASGDFSATGPLSKMTDMKIYNNPESVPYKRLTELLKYYNPSLAKADKKTINKAIMDYWNQQALGEGAITMPKPGDKEANNYFGEINLTMLGTSTPDASTKGSSILTGQLANANFTDEHGVVTPAKNVAEANKDNNVRITGKVTDWRSPLEYNSLYMVGENPVDHSTKHYLIEPDLSEKNVGGYFANKIYNSLKRTELVSKFSDGNGFSYEATPNPKYKIAKNDTDQSQRFIVYVQPPGAAKLDTKVPMHISENQLNRIANVNDPNVASRILSNYYIIEKTKKTK